MSLLDRLLSVFGLAGADDRSRSDREATVTVERAPDASDEAAVKGVDVDAGDGSTATDAPAGDDGSREATDADSTAGATDDGGAPASDATAEADAADETAEADAADEAAEAVKGIGPAYAERLGEAGIETVADLAGADAGDLAERTSLSETRLSRWIERARSRRE